MNKDLYFKKLYSQLEENQDKRIVFWGASLFLKDFLSHYNCDKFNIIGIIDNNSSLWGTTYKEYQILPPTVLKDNIADSIVFSIYSNNKINYKLFQIDILNKYPSVSVLTNIFEDLDNENLLNILNNNKELLNASIFNNLLLNSDWVLKKDFIPLEGAATYSLLNLLYIILEYFSPQNIIEFGMGQTSKLTTQYVGNKNRTATLQIVEHDEQWLKFFSKQLLITENIHLVRKDIEKFDYKGCENSKYSNLSDIIEGKKYDLIIIDGPIAGNMNFPRSNVLDLIPNHLDDEFMIILDDAERDGELNTAYMVFEKLKKYGITYYYQYRNSSKTQLVIATEKYRYVTYY